MAHPGADHEADGLAAAERGPLARAAGASGAAGAGGAGAAGGVELGRRRLASTRDAAHHRRARADARSEARAGAEPAERDALLSPAPEGAVTVPLGAPSDLGVLRGPERVDGLPVVVPDAAALDAVVEPEPALAAVRALPALPEDPEGLAALARRAGLQAVKVVAWRDLDDPEAGGSELHLHRVAELWASAGLAVTVRTSAVAGAPEVVARDGYVAVRRSGRYAVFADTALTGALRRNRPGEGLVEVWNGMPFFSPLWYRGPRVVFLHHVHAEMWRMVLPGWLARIGEEVERRYAPPLYRGSRIVTLSGSSRAEICELLGLPADRVSVAAPGIEPRFSPGPGRSPSPLVVAVGRLVPVKRFDLLLRALARVKAARPDLQAVVIGEGYERPHLEALRHELGADEWVAMPGRVDDDELAAWYRRAWVVASASLREGWGMTLTEAAACGTPAVATDIAGHRDAVVDGRTGLLTDGADGMASALSRILDDRSLRERLGRQALERARWFTWEATARTTLEALAVEAEAHPAGRRLSRPGPRQPADAWPGPVPPRRRR